MSYLIRGGTVISQRYVMEEKLDILIEGGRIVEIRRNIPLLGDCKMINATGFCISRGLLDMHVHLRDPGFNYKEDIVSGTKAAIAGGFTSVACMPNTNPVNDNIEITEYIQHKAKEEGYCKVYPIGAITKRLRGEELSNIAGMVHTSNGGKPFSGIVAISDDGNSVRDCVIMRKAMEIAKIYGIPVISHCEDKLQSMHGVMNEGEISKFLGYKGIPKSAEEDYIKRDLLLAKVTGCQLHIAHVSTKGGVELIRRAKEDGIRVTCEVTPHHLCLSEWLIKNFEHTSYKMNPPLRTEEDTQALVEGLFDGTIDVIASDHAPHSIRDKRVSFEMAPFGCIGLETTLLVVIDTLHYSYGMSISKIIEKMTVNPSKILNLDNEGLHVGDLVDLVIFDIKNQNRIQSDKFHSKARNTPFNNWYVRGRPEYVFHKGNLVFNLTEKDPLKIRRKKLDIDGRY